MFLQLISVTWLIQLKITWEWQTVNICDKISADSLNTSSHCEGVNKCQCLCQLQNKTWHKPYWNDWKSSNKLGFKLEGLSTKMGCYSVVCIICSTLSITIFLSLNNASDHIYLKCLWFPVRAIFQSWNFLSCKQSLPNYDSLTATCVLLLHHPLFNWKISETRKLKAMKMRGSQKSSDVEIINGKV